MLFSHCCSDVSSVFVTNKGACWFFWMMLEDSINHYCGNSYFHYCGNSALNCLYVMSFGLWYCVLGFIVALSFDVKPFTNYKYCSEMKTMTKKEFLFSSTLSWQLSVSRKNYVSIKKKPLQYTTMYLWFFKFQWYKNTVFNEWLYISHLYTSFIQDF